MVINAVGELKGTITAPVCLVGTIKQSDILVGAIDISSANIYYGQLKAVITDSVYLVGKFSEINTLKGTIALSEVVDSYLGDYVITPKIESQTMLTKNKKMEENITVLAIPYYETSNLSGKTVYIGGE